MKKSDVRKTKYYNYPVIRIYELAEVNPDIRCSTAVHKARSTAAGTKQN